MLHENVCWYNSVCSILLSHKENGMKVIIIGGVAGGAGTADRFGIRNKLHSFIT